MLLLQLLLPLGNRSLRVAPGTVWSPRARGYASPGAWPVPAQFLWLGSQSCSYWGKDFWGDGGIIATSPSQPPGMMPHFLHPCYTTAFLLTTWNAPTCLSQPLLTSPKTRELWQRRVVISLLQSQLLCWKEQNNEIVLILNCNTLHRGWSHPGLMPTFSFMFTTLQWGEKMLTFPLCGWSGREVSPFSLRLIVTLSQRRFLEAWFLEFIIRTCPKYVKYVSFEKWPFLNQK